MKLFTAILRNCMVEVGLGLQGSYIVVCICAVLLYFRLYKDSCRVTSYRCMLCVSG